jgi:hypothetical protein
LWIGLVKVRQKFKVSEVLETRSIIGHGVGRSWEVVDLVAVAMSTSVLAIQVA